MNNFPCLYIKDQILKTELWTLLYDFLYMVIMMYVRLQSDIYCLIY